MFTATPDFQISLRFSLRIPVFELQAILRQVHRSFGDTAKLSYLGKNWDPKIAPILPFYPRGSKLSLISFYGQRFPRYRQIFKIAISRQSSRSCTCDFFLPRESKLSLFLLIELIFCHIWAWNLVTDKRFRSYKNYTLFLPQGGTGEQR